ncbi:MAG: PQQ-binding-like beta-propeller repeat protein [Planctomycetota bacterium]
MMYEFIQLTALHILIFGIGIGCYVLILALGKLSNKLSKPQPRKQLVIENEREFAIQLLSRVLEQEPNESQTQSCMHGRTALPKHAWQNMQQKVLSIVVAVCLLQAGKTALAQADLEWASFQNGGQCSVKQELPTTWSEETNQLWQVDIQGYGQSSPVVVDGGVVVTSTSGEDKDNYHVACYDLDTGEQLWQQDFGNPTPEKNSSYVSRAAPSPTVDAAGIVYVNFEGGLVAAISAKGKVLWERNLVEEYGAIKARHGLASSLEQNESKLFVWIERMDAPYILALDKQTGKTAWKVDGVGATTWSSPRLVPIEDGSFHLVCSASGKICGFDPENGQRLWDFTEIANNTSCTPIPLPNGRFLIGASDGRGEQTLGKGAASNGVVQIAKTETGWKASFVWQASKATASFGSPIAHADSAFFVNRSGALFELDLETGKSKATKRTKAGSVWATPMVANNMLYVFGRTGTTSVIDLASGEEVATNPLWENKQAGGGSSGFGGSVLYAGAAAKSKLLLRRGDSLYCIGITP